MPETPTQVRALTQSLSWVETAHQAISGGTSTLAKSSERLIPGVSPYFTVSASGAYFTDLDGNEWLDCEMGMGSVPWGHANPHVVEAITEQAQRGTNYSTPDAHEAALARMILARFPSYERLRFLKSGADAVSASIRIARVHTRRARVITTEYHGWGAESVAGLYGGGNRAALGLAPGTHENVLAITDGNLAAILDAMPEGNDIAALVICPNRWSPSDVEQMREACTRTGTVLIFDEVTSGQRIGKQATAGRYSIWPDLLCLSKGLANGLPLAVILGTKELIDLALNAKITTAHATESLAFAAARACETMLAARATWPSWEDAANGMIRSIRNLLSDLAMDEDIEVIGDYASFAVRTRAHADFWSDPVRTAMVTELARQEIFTKGYVVLSDAHGEAECSRIHAALLDAVQKIHTHR